MADDLDVAAQLVQAKVTELETALQRRKLEGFDPAAGLDLPAAARLTLGARPSYDTDDIPLIIVDTDGFSDLSYTIHLGAQAVTMITTAAGDFRAALGAAVVDVPDLAAIVHPLLSFISSESDEIMAVSQTSGGQVRLEGTIPSPFALPFPEKADYWDTQRTRIAEDVERLENDAKTIDDEVTTLEDGDGNLFTDGFGDGDKKPKGRWNPEDKEGL